MQLSRSIDLDHDAPVNDCQIDYDGRLMAICGHDGIIRIKALSSMECLHELKAHDSHVWAVAWADPSFGTILASASFDSNVIVWGEFGSKFEIVHKNSVHSNSVNALSWAPKALGLRLTCASSDGKLSETFYDGKSWTDNVTQAKHSMGCLCVQWLSTTVNIRGDIFGLVGSGGCDGKVKLLMYYPKTQTYRNILTLTCHDWVRDIAFDRVRGHSNKITFASAVQDKKVVIAEVNTDQIGDYIHSSGENQVIYDKHVVSLQETPWKLSWAEHESVLHIVTDTSSYSYDLSNRELKAISS